MKFHFIGIGGMGMSGLARIMLKQRHNVTGSDISENSSIKTLRKIGAHIFSKHHETHVDETVDYVVVSSAIQKSNPELIKAQELNIPILHRREMLGEIIRGYKTIAITGAHGKTTTTALIGSLLTTAEFDPLVINGGIVNSIGSNVAMGLGSWCVVEADESDGSFLSKNPILSVITNIDYEHMDYFKTKENLLNSYKQFILNTSILGCTCVCIDDPLIREVIKETQHRTLLTYGFSEDANIRIESLNKSITGSDFTVVTQKQRYENLFLPMMGEHNVLNSLSLIGLAEFLGISEPTIRKTLAHFEGIQRRFTIRGVIDGAIYVDDYAHHPKEIETVIHSARQYGAKRIVAVVEPHRYSRVSELMEEYVKALNLADEIILIPLYSAFEHPIKNVSSKTLGRKLSKPHYLVDSIESLQCSLTELSKPGTTVLFMGAGKISKWCQEVIYQSESAA